MAWLGTWMHICQTKRTNRCVYSFLQVYLKFSPFLRTLWSVAKKIVHWIPLQKWWRTLWNMLSLKYILKKIVLLRLKAELSIAAFKEPSLHNSLEAALWCGCRNSYLLEFLKSIWIMKTHLWFWKIHTNSCPWKHHLIEPQKLTLLAFFRWRFMCNWPMQFCAAHVLFSAHFPQARMATEFFAINSCIFQ